jgi:hypothetical protein
MARTTTDIAAGIFVDLYPTNPIVVTLRAVHQIIIAAITQMNVLYAPGLKTISWKSTTILSRSGFAVAIVVYLNLVASENQMDVVRRTAVMETINAATIMVNALFAIALHLSLEL